MEFTEHLQTVTTNNNDKLTESHTLKVLPSRCLVAASESGRFPSTRFPNDLQP
jgi:hypothetical protein